VAVSNGSFKDQNGTAAVVIEGKKAGRRVTSSVIISGGSNKQWAYRSEVARILAALQMVNTVAQFYGIEEGKCIMAIKEKKGDKKIVCIYIEHGTEEGIMFEKCVECVNVYTSAHGPGIMEFLVQSIGSWVHHPQTQGNSHIPG
jgi:hypothetical protein